MTSFSRLISVLGFTLSISILAFLGPIACFDSQECIFDADCEEEWYCHEFTDGNQCRTQHHQDMNNQQPFTDAGFTDDSKFFYLIDGGTPINFDNDNQPLAQRPFVDIEHFIGLTLDDTGYAVFEIQAYLNVLGYNINENGDFDTESYAAYLEFQETMNLENDFNTSEQTILKLLNLAWTIDEDNPLPIDDNTASSWLGINKYTENDAVFSLQSRLKNLNFPVKQISGQFTAENGHDALRYFQIRSGLSASGEVTEETLDALNSHKSINDHWSVPDEFLETSITLDDFLAIPNVSLSIEQAEILLPYINLILKMCALKSDVAKSMLLSQIAHETAFFSTLIEIPSDFDSSMSVYKGRGFIQLTGLEFNYQPCENDLNIPIINHPQMVAQYRYAVMTTAWFWIKNNINRFIESEDIEGVVRTINSNDVHFDRRIQLYWDTKSALFGY